MKRRSKPLATDACYAGLSAGCLIMGVGRGHASHAPLMNPYDANKQHPCFERTRLYCYPSLFCVCSRSHLHCALYACSLLCCVPPPVVCCKPHALHPACEQCPPCLLAALPLSKAPPAHHLGQASPSPLSQAAQPAPPPVWRQDLPPTTAFDNTEPQRFYMGSADGEFCRPR